MSNISRIIFNFTNQCNMHCDFCYIPFDNKECVDLDIWKNIIHKCKLLGVETITFGGGDPFIYEYFPLLLEYTFKKDIRIQIDTNGVALNEDIIKSIKAYTSLISLPLEGLKEIHNKMRQNNTHYQTVIKWLKYLNKTGIPIKINTVATKINYLDLINLAQVLENYDLKKWSVYQYWALGPTIHNRSKFEINESIFDNLIKALDSKFPNLPIEPSTYLDRHNSYFFVTQTGRVYVMRNEDQESYINIGSIFDDNIVTKWLNHGNIHKLRTRTDKRIN